MDITTRFPPRSEWFDAHLLARVSGFLGLAGWIVIGGYLVIVQITLANQDCNTYCIGYAFLPFGLVFSSGPFLLGAALSFLAAGVWKAIPRYPATLLLILSAAIFGYGIFVNHDLPAPDLRPLLALVLGLPSVAVALASSVLFVIGRTHRRHSA